MNFLIQYQMITHYIGTGSIMEDAILMGPFVGELYWEAGRFAPMLPKMYQHDRKNKIQHPKYIILTRQDRFDLYGKFADILVDHSARIQPGDRVAIESPTTATMPSILSACEKETVMSNVSIKK